MKQLTFNQLKSNLTTQDIDQLVVIIAKGCRAKNTNRVRNALTYVPNLIPSYGILDRLVKENNDWRYCAGQSYPDEIRTVRGIILGDIE